MVKQEEIMRDEILEKFSRLVDFNTSFFSTTSFSVLQTMYIKGKIMKIERNELEWKKKKKKKEKKKENE